MRNKTLNLLSRTQKQPYLTYHNRKTTGVINNINNDIPYFRLVCSVRAGLDFALSLVKTQNQEHAVFAVKKVYNVVLFPAVFKTF